MPRSCQLFANQIHCIFTDKISQVRKIISGNKLVFLGNTSENKLKVDSCCPLAVSISLLPWMKVGKKKKHSWTICDVPISRAGLLAGSELSVPIVPGGIFHKEPGHLHQYTAMDLPSLRHREILAYGSLF